MRGFGKRSKTGKCGGGNLPANGRMGASFNVDLTITPVLGERNKPINYIGIMNDITKSVERQRELESTAHVSEALRLAQTARKCTPSSLIR